MLSLRAGLSLFLLAAPVVVHAQDLSPAVEAIATAGEADPPHLDNKLRMQEYLKSLIRPPAVLSNILIAGMEEGRNFPHEWERNGEGFEKRLGSQFAQYFLDNTIEVGVSGMLHEDNRYRRLGDGGFLRRFGNVVKSTVVVSGTNGGHTFALGQIAGAYGSWAIASQVWEPPSEQKGSRILLWGSVNLAAKGGRNLIKEFGPDLKHKRAASAPAHP